MKTTTKKIQLNTNLILFSLVCATALTAAGCTSEESELNKSGTSTQGNSTATTKGDKGDVGPQGPQGVKGDKGDSGIVALSQQLNSDIPGHPKVPVASDNLGSDGFPMLTSANSGVNSWGKVAHVSLLVEVTAPTTTAVDIQVNFWVKDPNGGSPSTTDIRRITVGAGQTQSFTLSGFVPPDNRYQAFIYYGNAASLGAKVSLTQTLASVF